MTRFARADGSKASNKRTYEEATAWEEMKVDMMKTEKKLKKKKKKKREKEREAEPFEENVEERVVKMAVVKELGDSGLEQLQNDQPLNNNNNNNNKKKKKRKSKDCEDTAQNTSDPQEVKENIIKDKLANKENDKKKQQQMMKKLSLEEKKKNFVIENGLKYKIFKNGKKKPWFDLPYEENEVMTRYKNFFIKRELVAVLDQFKMSLEEQGLDKKQITNKVLHKERKAHNQLRLELMREQICQVKDNGKTLPVSVLSKSLKKKLKVGPSSLKETSEGNDRKLFKKRKFDLKYEESELMTQFDGSWVLRDSLQHLQFINNKKKEWIISERMNGSTDSQLTPDEDIKHRRFMKKERRREERLLKLKLIEMAQMEGRQNRNSPFKKRKPGKYLGIEYNDDDQMVKFDGFYIKREGADRLNKLREKMTSSGCTEEEINKVLKNERRKEERILKNEKKLFCFKCRRVGHMISSCPQISEEKNGVDICYRCGSTEHMARNCPSNRGSSYSHATCFICGEVGHISRECPDNPKGLYPNGGCCNECGSVEHLKRDCPDLRKQFEDQTIKVHRFHRGQEIETFDEEYSYQLEETLGAENHNKSKVIRFED